ncbi:hypothetical protein LCGC14_2342110, partial [marine sediment metagenome]
ESKYEFKYSLKVVNGNNLNHNYILVKFVRNLINLDVFTIITVRSDFSSGNILFI